VAAGEAATVQKNHPTTGVAFGIVEKRVPQCYTDEGFIRLLLRDPDYETASRIKQAINESFPGSCKIIEPGIVRIIIPPRYYDDRFLFMSLIQKQRVVPDIRARVVISSQTGTVVVSENVTLSRAAVTHGNISVITGETPVVSQPYPRSRGQTVVVPRTEIDVVEEKNPLTVISETSTVLELAEALNALGVSPQDLSSIFQQLHTAGVLHAELVIK
jgi:flagellar P-ring protein precursor FlgI